VCEVRPSLLPFALMTVTGCAMSIQAHAGADLDSRGRGVHAGLMFGFGYGSHDASTGLVPSFGATSGTHNPVTLDTSVDFVYVSPSQERGVRPVVHAGVLGMLPMTQEGRAFLGGHASVLGTVIHHASHGGNDALAIGLDGAIGSVTYDAMTASPGNARLGTRLDLVVDFLILAEMSLSDFTSGK
jgi:hypothetical protein